MWKTALLVDEFSASPRIDMTHHCGVVALYGVFYLLPVVNLILLSAERKDSYYLLHLFDGK